MYRYFQHKIIFFTVNFHYKSKFENVVPVYFETIGDSHVINCFIKPQICHIASKLYANNNFCYLDADTIPLKNCDKIFERIKEITYYPLFSQHIYDYIIHHDPNVDANHETNLLKFLNFQVTSRTTQYYRQSNIFLMNNKCSNLLNTWNIAAQNKFLIDNWKTFSPVCEESLANGLLWGYNYNDFLGRIHIDLPTFSEKNIFEFLFYLNNPKEEDFAYSPFTKIPSKNNIEQICFLHGKLKDKEFDIIKSYLNYI